MPPAASGTVAGGGGGEFVEQGGEVDDGEDVADLWSAAALHMSLKRVDCAMSRHRPRSGILLAAGTHSGRAGRDLAPPVIPPGPVSRPLGGRGGGFSGDVTPPVPVRMACHVAIHHVQRWTRTGVEIRLPTEGQSHVSPAARAECKAGCHEPHELVPPRCGSKVGRRRPVSRRESSRPRVVPHFVPQPVDETGLRLSLPHRRVESPRDLRR